MAMTDEKIDQIYILALQAKNAGQQRIPVHVFPFPLTKDNLARHSGDADLTAFWTDLKPIYDHFESHRKVPSVKIDGKGRYSVK
jgi:murein L,D-transpeptidase YafK